MLHIPDLTAINAKTLTDADAVAIGRMIQEAELCAAWAAIAAKFPPKPTDWPMDAGPALAWKAEAEKALAKKPMLRLGARFYYRERPIEWINHWAITYDPRNAGRDRPAKMPFLTFPRQDELVHFLLALLRCEENGLAEKCRDMGATWICCAFSLWLWLYWPGAAVGWGSRKEQLVDKLGDPDSIFEKMRMILRALPDQFIPEGFSEIDHMTYMKFINPESGATITGEAGDNIGRGGRKLIYFKDESAHYERPEKIEAALADNTNVQVDISSVNGTGNVFHRRRESGKDWQGEDVLEHGRTAVFVMDWRDHPGKTQEWYDNRRQKAKDEGLLHVFAQEVDRDYSSSVEGIIIPAEWVRSAIDAHLKLGFGDDGPWVAALDVADGGGDRNALAKRKGVVLRSVKEWGERDTGATARTAVEECETLGLVDLQYDCIGVGAGVKAETNRLEEEGIMPTSIRMVPWNAGGKVLDADEPMIEGDRDSPLNKDLFQNMKAQAWWRLRLRFERTHRAVTEAVEYPTDELISLDSRMPNLRQIEKELSQPTASKSPRTMKMIVNKTPEGTRSPNLGDAIVMAYQPLPGLTAIYPIAAPDITVEPFTLPPSWRRGYGMKVEEVRTAILFGAYDADADVLYITSEHSRKYGEPTTNAQAVRARGVWQPGIIEPGGGNVADRDQMLLLYHSLGLNLLMTDTAIEAGIADMAQRLTTGRLKVFASCRDFLSEYRGYRRNEDGGIIGGGLMDCARLLCRPGFIQRMIVKPPDPMLGRGLGPVGDRRIGY